MLFKVPFLQVLPTVQTSSLQSWLPAETLVVLIIMITLQQGTAGPASGGGHQPSVCLMKPIKDPSSGVDWSSSHELIFLDLIFLMSRNGNWWFLSLSTSYYSEGDYGSPDSSHRRTPSFRLPPDSRSDLPTLNLAPLPGSPYEVQEEEEEEERTWRPGPRFPSFTDQSRGGAGGGGAPRRVYESEFLKTKKQL